MYICDYNKHYEILIKQELCLIMTDNQGVISFFAVNNHILSLFASVKINIRSGKGVRR